MKKAFTFVELIIIIVIIGIVVSAGVLGLTTVKAKARNTAKIANIQQIRGALQQYKNDNGFYPATSTFVIGEPLVGANGKTYLEKIPGNLSDVDCPNPFVYQTFYNNFEYNLDYCVSSKMDKLTEGNYIANASELSCVSTCGTKTCGSNGCGGYCSLDTPTCPFVCGVDSVEFYYMGSPVSYGTIVGANGATCWLDRNLGASHVAASSTDTGAYGDLFQWGRPADGHQVRTSGKQPGPVSTLTPGTAFVTTTNGEWTKLDIPNGTTRSTNWTTNTSSNPCPTGWYVPTYDQWDDQNIANAPDAYNKLKLTLAGNRDSSNGIIDHVNVKGFYWSSSVYGSPSSLYQYFYGGSGYMYHFYRAYGFTVRCLKDLPI